MTTYHPTMRCRVVVVVAVSLAGLLAGCGADPDIETDGSGALSSTPAGVDLSTASFEDQTSTDEPEVDALDNVFKAKFVEVRAGAEVTFRNDGRTVHNVLPVDEDGFAAVEVADFEPGAEATITFDEPGDYAYYCSLHGTTTKGMVGAVRAV